MSRIAVLGAGAVGVSAALYLQRDGHDVTLIDQDAPGSGASAGNAGLIQCASVIPVASPSTLRAVPKMLLDPNQPLVIRWRHIPTLMPYLLRFLAEADPRRVEHNSRALASIIPLAYEQGYRPLIEEARLHSMIRQGGELQIFETDAAFQAAEATRNIRRAHGVRVEVLGGPQVRELEPALATSVRHGALLPDAYQTVDPHRFVAALAQHFVGHGGRFVQARVEDLIVESPSAITVRTGSADIRVQEVVVALGAFSKPWVKRMGETVPLDSERGYHLMLPNPGVTLNRAVISGEYRFALSPIGNGIRLAGTAELARIGAPPNYDRARRLLPLAKRLLPGLSEEGQTMWMGHRPSTPDSLPVIGPSTRHRNVYYAFGHGHSGLTLGGMTGRLIADLAIGRAPAIDLAPFSIARFAGLRGARVAHPQRRRG